MLGLDIVEVRIWYEAFDQDSNRPDNSLRQMFHLSEIGRQVFDVSEIGGISRSKIAT